jgi:adenylate cyclase
MESGDSGDQTVARRLTAVLAADVVGYSRLMANDEVGALNQLKSLRGAVIDPLVVRHRGEIVGSAGDSFLIAFASAGDAVACALAWQQACAEAAEALVTGQRMLFRIGIHLGDVIPEGGTIYGDGVNIAARLEKLAQPGGLVVSRAIRDQVEGRMHLAFTDLGRLELKNIPRLVEAFEICRGEAAPRSSPASGANGSRDEPTTHEAPALPNKPSIAVLPLVNMSGDPDHEFFTDGLTEDIITDISNVPGLFVIARNSTFAYKGKPTDVRQIARDLGVKYVLEGSARRSANRLRVNIQLVNAAEGGEHVWAERFDREIADIFDVQDEVTHRVVEAIAGKLGTHAIPERYRPSSLEAYDLCVRSRTRWGDSKSANDEARSNLERAIALDPNYCEAHWQLATALIFGWLYWGDPQEPNRARALLHAQRAVDIDPGDSGARVSLGYVLLLDRRWDDAKLQYDMALRLNPNNADAFADLTEYYRFVGMPRESLTSIGKAMRLNPRPPGWYYWSEGVAQIFTGEYEKAVTTLRREETYQTGSRYQLAAALALLGRTSEARAEARLFLESSPHWRISTWLENQPFKEPSDADFLIRAFRLAGLPE